MTGAPRIGMRRWLLVALFGMAACGQTIQINMPRATPDLIRRARSPATFSIEPLSGVDPVCVFSGTLDTYCVHSLRREIEDGARTVLEGFLTPAGGDAAAYVGRFESLYLSARTQRYSALAVLEWHFTLRDAQGQPVIQLSDVTVGPVPLWSGSDSNVSGALEAVENAVLQRVRSAVGDSLIGHPSGG